MADFNKEFDEIILAEGGYVNDKDDAGGETYLGIARKHNPKWIGWRIIDDIKKKHGIKGINKILKANDKLTMYAKALYKGNYWDCMRLDEVPSQKIAHQLFDTGVNMGIRTAITIAQQITDMTITGKFSEELLCNLKQYEQND